REPRRFLRPGDPLRTAEPVSLPSRQPNDPSVPRHLPAATVLCLLAAAGAQSPWTQEQMTADLDEIAGAVRGKWSYVDDRRANSGVDVDALRAAAVAALPTVRSVDDFARVLRRFAAALQDGHAWSHVPGSMALPARRLPVQLVDCDEGLVVA